MKLLNLSTLSLNLSYNQIKEMGACSLFYPLSNLMSLSSLHLKLSNNILTKQIKHLFKHYIKKLKGFEIAWLKMYLLHISCYLNIVNYFYIHLWKNQSKKKTYLSQCFFFKFDESYRLELSLPSLIWDGSLFNLIVLWVH